MQRPSAAKRQTILEVAARVFAARPYHEVTLDHVAAGARVGKGTLYVYFASKEALFTGVLDEALQRIVADVRQALDRRPRPAWAQLRTIVRELVRLGRRFPDRFRLMRQGSQSVPMASSRSRDELLALIEAVLAGGARRGELRDPHPGLTAGLLVSCVRGALLYGPQHSERTIANHIVRVLGSGLLPAKAARKP